MEMFLYGPVLFLLMMYLQTLEPAVPRPAKTRRAQVKSLLLPIGIAFLFLCCIWTSRYLAIRPIPSAPAVVAPPQQAPR
jgi:hypothetical protein